MKDYMIRDFTDSESVNGIWTSRVYVVNEKELFQILNDIRNDSKQRISVYGLGDCVLDWS